MKINIGIGLENLVFGMHQEEIKEIMGNPDKISETENGTVYYFYDSLIITKFDKDEDCKLYSIEVFNSRGLLFNQIIIDKTKKEVLDLLDMNGYYEVTQEDYDSFETVFCEKIWSTFLFEFDKVRSVEFSPLFDDNDNIIWPKRE
jgi:hypothetical protein